VDGFPLFNLGSLLDFMFGKVETSRLVLRKPERNDAEAIFTSRLLRHRQGGELDGMERLAARALAESEQLKARWSPSFGLTTLI
jgi:hypothetical protein